MVFLHTRNFFELSINSVVVGGCLYVTNYTKGNGESVAVAHQGELQLQGIVLAVSIVNKNIIEGVAILADFYHLQAKALLN